MAIAGGFSDQLALGAPPLVSQSTMSGGYNGFWATLEPGDGSPIAVHRFGGTTFDLANTINATPDGALRIGGQLSGTSVVGGMTATALTNGSAFIAEVTTGGAARWVRVIDGRGIVFGADINAAGRTFAAGRLDGATSDSILASVGADGVLTLPLRIPTGESNGAVAAAADRHGGVWVAGELVGSANFGTGPSITSPSPQEPTNYLLHLEP
ncbi:MAG: hypothetical protein ABJA82_01115 [Myxococcales bacterium]